jgi:hypothetical protein
MAKPPGTKTKPVSKAELERQFDAAWEHTIKNHTPHNPVNLSAIPDLGLPPGARTLLCIFEGGNGSKLAVAEKHIDRNAEPVTGRLYHPTGVMVDGIWLYHEPSLDVPCQE